MCPGSEYILAITLSRHGGPVSSCTDYAAALAMSDSDGITGQTTRHLSDRKTATQSTSRTGSGIASTDLYQGKRHDHSSP